MQSPEQEERGNFQRNAILLQVSMIAPVVYRMLFVAYLLCVSPFAIYLFWTEGWMQRRSDYEMDLPQGWIMEPAGTGPYVPLFTLALANTGGYSESNEVRMIIHGIQGIISNRLQQIDLIPPFHKYLVCPKSLRACALFKRRPKARLVRQQTSMGNHDTIVDAEALIGRVDTAAPVPGHQAHHLL